MIKHDVSLYLNNLKELFSKKFITVVFISIPSAVVADYLNIPLAWMIGPMIITSIAALFGLKINIPKLVLNSILIILGLHIGNYIDQNLFSQMVNWIWTSIIMLVYIIVCILIVAKYLKCTVLEILREILQYAPDFRQLSRTPAILLANSVNV